MIHGLLGQGKQILWRLGIGNRLDGFNGAIRQMGQWRHFYISQMGFAR